MDVGPDIFEELNPLLLAARAAADGLQRPARQALPQVRPSPPGSVWCACNKKCIPLDEVSYYNSKYVKGITDSMCRDCCRQLTRHALIVCIHCKAVVAKPAPQRYPSGFVIETGGIYHTNGCPNCLKAASAGTPEPGTVTHVTVLIEKVMFEYLNKFPIKPEIIAGLKLKKQQI